MKVDPLLSNIDNNDYQSLEELIMPHHFLANFWQLSIIGI